MTISTIITGLKSSLPRVSYLTALDIYLWTCYFFVFSAVLEFCVLNFLMARKGRVRDKLVESRIKVNQNNKNGMANTASTTGRNFFCLILTPPCADVPNWGLFPYFRFFSKIMNPTQNLTNFNFRHKGFNSRYYTGSRCSRWANLYWRRWWEFRGTQIIGKSTPRRKRLS